MLSDQVREIPVAAALAAHNESAVLGGTVRLGELSLDIDPAHIVEVCRFLKHDQKFVRLSAITGVDWYPSEPRLEVVYLLHSLEKNQRLRLKCRLSSESLQIDSVVSLWRGADWYERETFDLFGIVFRNHPNLTRIMMPEGWQGHPLRKDFPKHGYRYSYADE
jgi:NADH-quinone oxidoreductase subunit C